MKEGGRRRMEGRKRREWEEWRKEGQQEEVGKGEKRASRGKGEEREEWLQSLLVQLLSYS